MRELSKSIKDAIKGGLNQPFWLKGLKPMLEDDVNVLTQRITGETTESISDERRNQLIEVLRAYKSLLNLSERMSDERPEKPKSKTLIGSSDPYHKTEND